MDYRISRMRLFNVKKNKFILITRYIDIVPLQAILDAMQIDSRTDDPEMVEQLVNIRYMLETAESRTFTLFTDEDSEVRQL